MITLPNSIFLLTTLLLLLSHPTHQTHVVIETAILSATHFDGPPPSTPPSGLTPFTLSHFTATNTTTSRSLSATLLTSKGSTTCSVPVTARDVVSDVMYACEDGVYFGYPREGHVVVLGWVGTTTQDVIGNGHGDVQLQCDGDGDVCSQVGEKELRIEKVFTWVDPGSI
ncbi:hypothetical protein EJ04DRAFT_512986 [Polyplosphaeria fusca]|uniref:Uncharacterized protein n=1 Tax=Polyplosphaeria fusca TaxID=682080 RepID=A0A9P4QYU6_9PLEO|nr:hypothetical protein EJ04DRAFT_512986 [Polyplosphaeria fusca]